jgi:hypothetical protein
MMGRACITHGEKRKPERKRPLGRPRPMWEDNIKMILGENEVVCTGLIWLRTGASGGLF